MCCRCTETYITVLQLLCGHLTQQAPLGTKDELPTQFGMASMGMALHRTARKCFAIRVGLAACLAIFMQAGTKSCHTYSMKAR